MKYPGIHQVQDIVDNNTQVKINNKYVAARPLGYPSFFNRIKIAWYVFSGKADALIWPENQ